jgi:cell division protein FtsW (lipid II flippase)
MGQADKSDDWQTGSAWRPWVNPPMRHPLGSGARWWRVSFGVVVLAFVGVVTVLVLVRQDVLDRGWAYVALVIGLLSAFAARLIGTLKASAEDKKT